MCKRIFANQTTPEGEVPFYKIGTIGDKADAYISKKLFEEYKQRYNYPKCGEVMITCAGTVGKTILYNGQDAYYQDSNIVWISNPRKIYSNEFLNYLLNRVDWSKLNSTTITRIYNDNLRELHITFPSREEQDKIVSLLTRIDDRIDTQIKIIEEQETLLKSLADKLFLQNNHSCQLSELVNIEKGKQLNADTLSETGDYYVMNGGITPSGYYSEYNVPAGAISISEGGNSCGYVQFNEKPFWSGGHCYSLQCRTNLVDYKYIYYYLKTKEADVMALRIGSGLPNIQKKDIEKFTISYPSLQLQKQFVKALDALSGKINTEKNLLEKYCQQKSYLLSQMFI